jgi:hypothetical protein
MPALEVDSSDACAPYPNLEIAIWVSVSSDLGPWTIRKRAIGGRTEGGGGMVERLGGAGFVMEEGATVRGWICVGWADELESLFSSERK